MCCDRDPFAAHRHQMRSLFGSFGMDPFPMTPQIQHPRTRIQVLIRTFTAIESAIDMSFHSILHLAHVK